jgi:hypothetical protein
MIIRFAVALAIFLAPHLANAGGCSASDQDRAKTKMQAAFGFGILRNDPDKSEGLSIFIQENEWRRMNFAQKTDFFQTLECAIVGPGKALSQFRIRSDMTGRTLGTWYLGNLKVN